MSDARQMIVDKSESIAITKRRSPGAELIELGCKFIQIVPIVNNPSSAASLLWCELSKRASYLVLVCVAGTLDGVCGCKLEINKRRDVLIARDNHIGGVDVFVDHAFAMNS